MMCKMEIRNMVLDNGNVMLVMRGLRAQLNCVNVLVFCGK